MKNKYKYLKILLLLFIFVNSLYAGPKNKYGLSAAPELLIPVGSVSTALGGSNLANASGLDALYWNPAGLTTMPGKLGEVMFSNQIYVADIDINYFAAAYNLPSVGTFGVSIKGLGFGDIPITTITNPEGTGETFSPTYLTGGLSYAKVMTDRISFGTTVKVVYNKIARESATTFAFDFGLNYNVTSTGLQFGVVLRNFGPGMTFTGQDLEQFYVPVGSQTGTPAEPRMTELADFSLPTSLSLGLSYKFNLDKTNNLMAHTTFQNNSFASDDYNFGLEYNYNKIVYLRGGYQFTNDNSTTNGFNGISFGAGFNYAASSNFNIAFDYAYKASDVFDANQHFTISLGF